MAGEDLPVQLATRVLGVSESGYYAWRDRAPSARSLRHAWLTETIGAIHVTSHGTYGARRVHAELTLGHGLVISHGTVELLMRRAGIKGLPGNKRRRPKAETPTAADLVNRDFTRKTRDQLWVTDITEHPTREGKVYCAVVLDTYSRRVVGWSIDATQTAALVTNALGMAIGNRRPAGTLIHSDKGRPIHLLGLHPARAGGRSRAFHGIDWRLLRQRADGVVLGAHADRATQPPEVADQDRTGERDLRIPRDLPQPPSPSQRPRHAHPDRI